METAFGSITTAKVAGVKNIKHVESVSALNSIIERGGVAITEDYSLLCKSDHIDILMDITGIVEFGVELLETAFANKGAIASLTWVFNLRISSDKSLMSVDC